MEGYLVPFRDPSQDRLILTPRPSWCVMKESCTQQSRLLPLSPSRLKTLRFCSPSQLRLSRPGIRFTSSGAMPTGATRVGPEDGLRAADYLLGVSLRRKGAQLRSCILVRQGLFQSSDLGHCISSILLLHGGSEYRSLPQNIHYRPVSLARRTDSLCKMRRLPSCLYKASGVGYAVHARPESNCVTRRFPSPGGKIFVSASNSCKVCS